jgi:homoisocitrate dehydrogenase
MLKLCVIEGDGIGKEVIPAAVEVLQHVFPDLDIHPAEAGWDCFQRQGVSVPPATLQMVRECGAALFGAVSSPSRKVEGYRSAILTLRQELNLYANLRPIHSLPGLSPRPDVDLMIVRENSEGLYCGRERMDGDTAIAERVITRAASRRIGQTALDVAIAYGRKRITIVHKANILPITDGLFRDSVREVAMEMDAARYDISLDELLVDNAAYQLAANPQAFEVIVTTNLFGDILSDEAAVWCGGMGMAPSINLGVGLAIAEPVHGSAPDIAGKGIANPIAAILSAALLVRYTWHFPQSAERIESAIQNVIAHDLEIVQGKISPVYKTEDITRAVMDRLE